MEELIGIAITLIISTGILGGGYIYFKDKLKYIGTVASDISELLIYLNKAIEDDKITKYEVEQIIARIEILVDHIKTIIGGK